MNEQLISSETAKLASDKGYFGYYFNGKFTEYIPIEIFNNPEDYVLSPQSLLQKWLREKHHLIIIVAYQYEHDSTPYSYWIYKEFQSLPINQWINDLNTYEEALEKGLQEALKLI